MSQHRFRVVVRGYDRPQVDALMARVDGTIGAAPLTGPPVTAAELASIRGAFDITVRGYERPAVDGAIDEAIAVLGGAPPLVGSDAAAGPSVPAQVPARSRAEMLQRLQSISFTTTRVRAGYDTTEVDRFLERVQAALTGVGPALRADDIRDVEFSTTMLRAGYDEEEVDALLDELAAYFGGSQS